MATFGATYDSGNPSGKYDPFAAVDPAQLAAAGIYIDSQGNHYTVNPRTGERSYIETYQQAQQAAKQSGLLSSYEFNPQTGQLERKTNWGNLIGLAAGAEPLIAGGAAALGIGAGGTTLPEPVQTLAGGLDLGLPADAGSTGALSGLGAGAPSAISSGAPGFVGSSIAGTEAAASPAALASAPLTLSSGATLPATVAPVVASSGLPAGAAAATAGGGFTGFVKALGGPAVLVPAAATLGSALIQSSAANNAATLQAQAAQNALNVATQEYNTNTGLNVGQANQVSQAYNTALSNLAPYRGIGGAALSRLGYGLGLPGYEGGNTSVVNQPSASVPVQPLSVPPPIQPPGSTVPAQSVPNQAYLPLPPGTKNPQNLPQRSTGNNWSSPIPPNLVTLRAPNGQVSQVPADQASHYLSLGATQV